MSTVVEHSAKDVLALYRSFLRNASKFGNYNFRSYFLRKTRDTFRENKNITDKEQIDKFFKQSQLDLAILKRQATISQMYHFDKTVVEKL
ncbi:hypothetical protein PACTADRAFT_185377 [Pachysolen tannophilus NRRL Y-2460]|uniref:Complex 1 LYR protein domain-containing protein n=1 Tax=Pachysolen tannophilus NRRL Y-2460 TaxID=669874 RepID=A0A1E4U2G4_PACTA|nr:hypothetical protein PACTADRAFT_185377 [Pachysolen tannophilus NRRL Y-2460]